MGDDADAQWKSWLEGLIDKMIEDKFLLFIDGYCDKHFEKFCTGSSEYTLEQTIIHGNYKRFFESRMESYLRETGVSTQDFIEVTKRLVEKDEAYGQFLENLELLDDFEQFAAMMRSRGEAIDELVDELTDLMF